MSGPFHELGSLLCRVWQRARLNHHNYSETGSKEGDLRFFALGLSGEAGEFANLVKKRWRDGDEHEDELKEEISDVIAYAMMAAEAVGHTPESLLEEVNRKQKVFVDKMEARTGGES